MWRHAIYRFPEDHLATLFQVLGELPTEVHLDLDWTVSRDLLVVINNPVAAMCVRMALEGERITDDSGQPVLADTEVMIATEDRAECIRLLEENYVSSSMWLVPVCISTRGDAQRQFDEVYAQIVPTLIAAPSSLCRESLPPTLEPQDPPRPRTP